MSNDLTEDTKEISISIDETTSIDQKDDSFLKSITYLQPEDQSWESDLIGGIFIPPEKSETQREIPKTTETMDEYNITNALPKNLHISISPDGKNVLIFNHETFNFRVIDERNQNLNTKEHNINGDGTFETEPDDAEWMVAISNCNSQGEVIVAISQIKKLDMTSSGKKKTSDQSDESDSESEESDTSDNKESCEKGKTAIYRVNSNELTKLSEWSLGGIVSFIHTQTEEETKDTYFFIFNVDGIYRKTFTGDSQNLRNKVDKRYKRYKGIDHFKYPERFRKKLTLYKKKPLELLDDSIFDHYFFTEQYREGIRVLQLYNLTTMEMEQTFKMREEKKSTEKVLLASSNNKRIIAFSSGRKISLFLKDNGLEIASENFGNDVKILFCKFINNDETLMIIIQELKSKTGRVLFWNLFNTKHKFKLGRKINFEKISSFTRVPGNKLININTDGKIFSLLDNLIKDSKIKGEGVELHSIVVHKEKEGTPNKMQLTEIAVNKENKEIKRTLQSTETGKVIHRIYHRKYVQKGTKPFIENKEPWETDDYNRISVYLDEEENVQLFIGRNTVQVWRKVSKNKTVLEYIWTVNIGEEECELKVLELYVGERSFYLKVRWDELDQEFVEVKWPYENHVTPIKHACDALEYLNYRTDQLTEHEFEEMRDLISCIVWKFIKHKPDVWRLMDVRFDVMAKIIIGGSNTLVKYILFGDGKENNWDLHIPKLSRRWGGKDETDENKIKKRDITVKRRKRKRRARQEIKNLSDLQIAIRLCKGADTEISRRTLTVTYLLEYYMGEKSLKHIGWLATISEAIPDLYNCGLESYAKELFYKRCISDFEINDIEYTDFIPKEIEFTLQSSQNFQAFSPISKLIPNKDTIGSRVAKLYRYVNLKNKDDLQPLPPIKVVPLYNFTVSKIPQKQSMQIESQSSFLTNIFKLLFIPRGYYDSDKSQLSPLVQIIISANDDDDDIFNNPAMSAAIEYRWHPARNYFLRIFFMYLSYAICFAAFAGCYLGHIEATGQLRNFLVFLFILFYYLGFYLFMVECMQFKHRGWKHYLDFFNFVDLASIVTSLVIMSVYVTPKFNFSNAFADVTTTPDISAAISLTMLLLWFEFMLYLRLLPEPAKYLYVIINIINKTFPFVAFMIFVILAFSHVFFLLLQNSSIVNDSGEAEQDNPSKDFSTSFLSAFSWLRGAYPQDSLKFWAVQVLIAIGSLFLIIILQNMFIALLCDIYSDAYKKGNASLLRLRVKLISDYEALNEIYFNSPSSESKYIYFAGESKSYDAWDEAVKKREEEKVKLYDEYENIIGKKNLKLKWENGNKNNKNSLWNYNYDDKSTFSESDKNIFSKSENDDDEDDDDDEDEDVDKIEKILKILNNDRTKIDEILKSIKKHHEQILVEKNQ